MHDKQSLIFFFFRLAVFPKLVENAQAIHKYGSDWKQYELFEFTISSIFF